MIENFASIGRVDLVYQSLALKIFLFENLSTKTQKLDLECTIHPKYQGREEADNKIQGSPVAAEEWVVAESPLGVGSQRFGSVFRRQIIYNTAASCQ